MPRDTLYTPFCRARWTGWGTATASGTGVLRNGLRQWGATIRLDTVAWCLNQGLTYTHETLTTYGDGEPIPRVDPRADHGVTAAQAKHLLHDIGRKPKHVYQQTKPGCTAPQP
jgi:hypothetical protein